MESAIQSYLRTLAGRRRDAERVGPFVAAFDPTSDNPFRNYALPDDDATPTPGEVDALIAAFGRRQRQPRLEYVPSAAPAVEEVLLARGFVAERRLPLMTITPEALRAQPVPDGVELVLPATDDDLLATATVQNLAYGEPVTTQHDVDRLRATLAAGGIIVLARGAATGEAIGSGLCSPPHAGITEIAAVGVAPAQRRRGVATALCARLARAAFAAGVTTPFLTPEGPDEERIYRRVGFARAGEILHISRPHP